MSGRQFLLFKTATNCESMAANIKNMVWVVLYRCIYFQKKCTLDKVKSEPLFGLLEKILLCSNCYNAQSYFYVSHIK